MIVCPKCRYKSDQLEEWDIESVLNGVRIQIKYPKCGVYTAFLDEEEIPDDY